MSLSIYCQECGEGTLYKLKKPKVCSQCGVAFDSANYVPPASAKTSQQNKAPTFIVSKEEQEPEIPILDKLDLKIVPSRRRVETLGNVMNSAPQPMIQRPGGNGKFSKNKFLKEWQAEAGGTSRLEIGD